MLYKWYTSGSKMLKNRNAKNHSRTVLKILCNYYVKS